MTNILKLSEKTYVVIPCMALVVDDGSPKTSCRVDTSSSDGDGGQMDQEHRKPNWERSQDLHSNQKVKVN